MYDIHSSSNNMYKVKYFFIKRQLYVVPDTAVWKGDNVLIAK